MLSKYFAMLFFFSIFAYHLRLFSKNLIMSKDKSIIEYRIGGEYAFTINAICDDYCELIDESGFRVYLQHTNGYPLARNQRVKCRVIDNKMRRPRIELVCSDGWTVNDSKVNAKAVSDLLAKMGVTWDSHEFVRLLLMVERENSFEDECRHWIASQFGANSSLECRKADLMRFMEQSSFLTLCNPSEREMYQQRLSLIIELAGDFIFANRLLQDKEEEDYVDSLFGKLRLSGYVYKPERAFNVLACLFSANKELMSRRMAEVFDILRQWQVGMWQSEPFNGALVKLLQTYIDESVGEVDRVKDNATLVSNLSQALTIQLLLADGRNDSDLYRKDLSRLCTLSTYQNFMPDPKRTMSLALTNLLDASRPRVTYDLTDTVSNTVVYKIANEPAHRLDTVNSFLHERAKLVVDGMGIRLCIAPYDSLKPMLPDGLSMWQGLQVQADRNAVKALPDKPNIMDCKQFWVDIEQEMFASKPQKASKSLKRHRVEDKVKIAITYRDERDPNMFHCRIADETGGDGYIMVNDIVPYTVNASLGHFKSPTGRTMLFDARIIENEDDTFRFSMLNEIKEWAEDSYDEDAEVECWVGADSPQRGKNGRIPAITRDGVSVSLGGLDDLDCELKKGDVAVMAYQYRSDGTFHVMAKALRRSDNGAFDVGDAFHELMIAHANGAEETPATVDERDFEQNDRILDVPHVKELVRIIDRLAVIDSEYVKAYNYLGFVRVLCRMVGWEDQAAYYRGRMELIVLLHDFAVNDVVDDARLRNLETMNADLFRNNTLLHNRFMQLQAVSCMGKMGPERDGQLWQMYVRGEGLVKDVASLVIAYNMLSRNGMEKQAIDIQNRIKQTLRLEGYKSNLKIYGTGVEDETTEYKSSMVYPSDNGMLPNMDAQLKNILYVIAAFLNTQGGTLYIGVNDFGAGVGIENDLAYKEFHGDKDKYQRTLVDAVAKEWGNAVATHVRVAFDSDNADKDVLEVNVRPYAQGVCLDGKWWVRVSSTKRGLTKAEFDRFNTDNRSFTSEDASSGAATETPIEVATKVAEPTVFNVSAKESDETLPTSPWRHNVLVEQDDPDNFIPYLACIKLLDKGKWSKVDDYDWQPSLLTLAVYEEERGDYLVLGYADGAVAKVPVKELLKFDSRRIYARCTASPLRFATIAKAEDGIVSITREDKAKGRLMVRVDTIARIEECQMSGKGMRLYQGGLISEVSAYGVLPAAGFARCKKILDLDEHQLGRPLATLSGEIKALLDKWVE